MLFFRPKTKGSPDKKPAGQSIFSGHQDALRNPKILEVNLIRDEVQISFDWQKNMLMLALVLVFGFLLMGEAYWLLGRWEESENARVESLVNENNRLNAEVAKLKNDNADALSYQEKSAVFTELLNNHVYWTGLFDWLEKNTLNTVHFSSFSGDLTGTYELQATADSYSTASWQARQFMGNPAVESVSIKEVSSGGAAGEAGEEGAGASTVQFVLSFELKPEIFRK